MESIALNAHGTRVLSGGTDGDVVEWSLDDCKLERIVSYGGPVRAVAYARNGKAICAGGDSGTVAVWPSEKKNECVLLKGHDKAVISLTLLSGSRVVSGSSDTTAFIWSLPDRIKGSR